MRKDVRTFLDAANIKQTAKGWEVAPRVYISSAIIEKVSLKKLKDIIDKFTK